MADETETKTQEEEPQGGCNGCPSSGGCDAEQSGAEQGSDSETTTSVAGEEESFEGALTITSSAADKIKEIMTQEVIEGSRLRIMVRGGGCSGFTYDIAFDEKKVDGKTEPAMALLNSER